MLKRRLIPSDLSIVSKKKGSSVIEKSKSRIIANEMDVGPAKRIVTLIGVEWRTNKMEMIIVKWIVSLRLSKGLLKWEKR